MTEENTNVNLEEFIFEALKQIVNGVKKAQQHAKENGAEINANNIFRDVRNGHLEISNLSTQPGIVQEIEFDIAISATAQGNLKGGIGLFIPAAGIGYQAQKETGNSTVSRIKFKVPLTFPQQE